MRWQLHLVSPGQRKTAGSNFGCWGTGWMCGKEGEGGGIVTQSTTRKFSIMGCSF